MNNQERMNEILETEMENQMLYNKYMINVTNPEIRQLFMQFRDEHMQHITQIQQELMKLES